MFGPRKPMTCPAHGARLCSRARRHACAQRGYHKMSLLYHPDKLGDKSDEDKAAGNAMFIKVTEAYGVLSDEESRRKYDLWVRSGRKRRPASGDDMGPMPVCASALRHGASYPQARASLRRAQGGGRKVVLECRVTRCLKGARMRHQSGLESDADQRSVAHLASGAVAVDRGGLGNVCVHVLCPMRLVLCVCRRITATIRCGTCKTHLWRSLGWQ